jgi:predicted phage terminase large subunit-like protein
MWPGKWSIEALMFEMLSSVRSIWIREKLNDLRAMAGKVFRREWFRYFEELESYDFILQVWDTAFEESASADYSVCVTAGIKAGTVDVLEVFRRKLEMPELIEAMKAQYTRWRPREIRIENKASGKSALQVLKRETGLPVVEVDPQGRSKVERARAVTPYLESGRVRFRLGANWLEAFEDELVLFPDGEHDDQVDALTYALLIVFGVVEERGKAGPVEAERAVVHHVSF